MSDSYKKTTGYSMWWLQGRSTHIITTLSEKGRSLLSDMYQGRNLNSKAYPSFVAPKGLIIPGTKTTAFECCRTRFSSRPDVTGCLHDTSCMFCLFLVSLLSFVQLELDGVTKTITVSEGTSVLYAAKSVRVVCTYQ